MNFIRENWKIAAVFAAGAFILSLITGLVAGNPFGVVIFRALLFGVVFAALGAGLRYVVKKFLPELLTQSTAKPVAAPPDESARRGTKVDIVLPEESPPLQDLYGAEARGAQGSEAEPETMEALEGEPGEGDAPQTEAEAAALGELASELAEELPPEEGQETLEAAEGTDAGEALEGDVGAGQGDTDVDSLPDIANLETSDEPEEKGRSSSRRKAGTPEDAVRGAVSGQDPATIARAIRTVLRRDEKG
jgi:hypothetical protein